MPSPWTGFFNKAGSPAIQVAIGGAAQSPQKFDATIDTGFTGFLSMPLFKAFPLGLILVGTTSVVLADGSTAYKLTAWGIIEIGSQEQGGVIILEPGSDELLLGMDFLRQFKRELQVNPVNRSVTLQEIPPPSEPQV